MLLLDIKPDGFVVIYNLSVGFAYLMVFLRYIILLTALIWTIFSFLNLWAVANSNGGAPSKLFPSRAQPTVSGAWIQLLISGIAFSLAWQLTPATLFSSVLTGSTDYTQVYSVGTYVAPTNTDQLKVLVSGLLITSMQFVGMIAWYRGLGTWWNISQGTSDKGLGTVLSYFFFGTLCFAFPWVTSLISGIIGINILDAFK